MPQNFRKIVLTIFFFACVLPTFAQNPQKRVALVIGNGSYGSPNRLTNPPVDAGYLTEVLTELGFEVLSGVNTDKKRTENLIDEFAERLAGNGGIGLFYYTGLGFQANGENFLVPVDANFAREEETVKTSVSLNTVLSKLSAAKNELNLILLDPTDKTNFQSIWQNRAAEAYKVGFGRVPPPANSRIFYSAETGRTAADRCGQNGNFVAAFLNQIKKPNLEFGQLANNISDEVSRRTNRQQQPFSDGLLTKPFYLVDDEHPLKTPEKRSLDVLFDRFKAARKCPCGERDDSLSLGKQIIKDYENDEINSEIIAYVKKQLSTIEKEDPICRDNERYNAAYQARDWNRFFTLSKEIIAKEGDSPLALDVMLTLVSVGYNRTAVDRFEMYSYDTFNFAKVALQKLEANQPSSRNYGVFEPFKTRDNARSWMNYIIGYYINRAAVDGSKKKEALAYFYKSTQFGTENKNDVSIYTNIGGYYYSEAMKLDEEYRRLRAANKNKETAAAKAKLALAKGYSERAIDAFVRARQIATQNKASQKVIDALNKNLNELYRYRYDIAPDKKPEGIEIYFEKLISQPMPNPETIVEPILQ
jgi:hypothetical protein